jgi:hypothetical protein
MNVTIFTGNQPRHIAAINSLARVADRVFAIQECTTLNVGGTPDLFRASDTMRAYFAHVRAAELEVFGVPTFTAQNVSTLSMRMGELNNATAEMLNDSLHSDYYFVFGTSWIKGWLCDHLVGHAAINIHMGIAPQYRGSSCNFWAMYDGHPEIVGATLHYLTRRLDDGAVITYARPVDGDAPWVRGMRAVTAGIDAAASIVKSGCRAHELAAIPQNKSRQIRYSRMADFTDAVALEYLERVQ